MPTRRRVMLDLETIGLNPGCTIVSIGAVEFDVDEIGETFEASISLDSCEEAGLTIEAGTLEWWLGQEEAARRALTGGGELETALSEFSAFYRGETPATTYEIWAASPAFDCVILEAAYEALDMLTPWKYYQQRDVRTLTKLVEELGLEIDVEHEGVEHDALDDAYFQAAYVAEALAVLDATGAEAETGD